MSTTVTYKGNTLVTVSNNTKTLKTAGKYMEGDVVLTDVSGGSSASKKQIDFIDYDGTILYSYSKAEWQSVTALPSNPSHTGLTAQGWNWTKAQIDAQLTAMPDDDVWVGQMYITDNGKTRIYIHLEEGRLHPYLGICPNGTVVVDWGDGSATATLTGTSLSTVTHADHAYANGGDYVITLTVSSGRFAFYGVANTSHILKKDTSTTANVNRAYTNAVQKIELGQGTNIGVYAFQGCYSLASITMPSTVTSIDNLAFQNCYSLASVTIPSEATSIGSNVFQGCYSLENIAIPSTVTSIGAVAFYNCYSLAGITMPSGVTAIGDNAFNNCQSLARLTIPSGVTKIGTYTFNNCHSLASLTIPSGVTTIGNNAFNSCYGMAEYHIKPTSIPTLGTTAFANIASDCVIYVPSAKLTDYKGASNWSAYASYMQGE